MASNERAIVNNLNERARFFGGPDAPQLTIYDVRAVLQFFDRKSCKSGEPATSLDHVNPLSLGGENIVENLQVLTVSENKGKGDKEIDYRKGKICTAEYVANYIEEYETKTPISSDDSSSNLSRRGGARENAGRKPKEVTILKRRLVQNKVEEAEASFAFLVEVRDNDSEPIAQRLAAAESILDRVLGKPTTLQPNAGEDLYRQYSKLARMFVFGNNESGTDEPAQVVQPGEHWLLTATTSDTDTLVA